MKYIYSATANNIYRSSVNSVVVVVVVREGGFAL
jgi:hypothetical protein